MFELWLGFLLGFCCAILEIVSPCFSSPQQFSVSYFQFLSLLLPQLSECWVIVPIGLAYATNQGPHPALPWVTELLMDYRNFLWNVELAVIIRVILAVFTFDCPILTFPVLSFLQPFSISCQYHSWPSLYGHYISPQVSSSVVGDPWLPACNYRCDLDRVVSRIRSNNAC